MASSDEHKAKGNAAFQAGNFQEAIQHFTDGLTADPNNHVLYSNRSAAQASQGAFQEALEDAQKVVELKPDWPKGYSRMGAAQSGLKHWSEAIAAYKKGLELDPNNLQMQNSLADAEAAASPKLGGMFGPDFMSRLALNPQTRPYLSQPDFMAKLQDLQRNPANLSNVLGDPRFQQALSVGMGLNVMSGSDFSDSMARDSADGAEMPEPPREEAQPMEEEAPEPEPEPEVSSEEQEAKQREAEAQSEKELGNVAYKKKDFTTAIGHYDKAVELNPNDISFLTNRAAAYYEMGDMDKAIENCDAAVEKGRELRADYKTIAKALTRKANALVKQGRLEEAVESYNKSLTEHRNPDTLKRLQDTEKALKQQRETAYINLELSNQEKELGNAAFKEQRYPEAVKHYSEALKRGPPSVNPEAYKLYSNRAACFTKLGAWADGVKDADETIKLKPDFVKGYSRKGHLQFFMKEHDKALETYEEGLKHDPNNEELKEGIRRCYEAISKISRGEASEDEIKDRQQKAMANPEIQHILTDPIMRQVLNDFQEDPAAAQKHLRQPDIAAKIQKLVQAGIVQLR